MGISSKQLAHDSHDLPQLIDDITKGTKGWSNAERGKALAQAFGRENQAAANALVKAGSASLRGLTKDTENAGGATKKVADQMNNTAEANVKKMIASLQVLGIEIGEKLLPKLTPLIKKATDVVEGFSKMDDATQNTIIKFAALAVAAGPVLSIVGKLTKGFGLFGGGIVQVVSKIAQWHAKNQAVKESVDMLGGATESAGRHFKSLKGDVDTVNGSATTAKSSFGLLKGAFLTAESGAGVLGTSLTVTGAALTGVGLAAVAGVAYWELYGKKASESAARVDKWGSDVGAQADSALTKFKGFSTNASTSLTDFEKASETSTKNIAKNFSDMYTEMEKDSKDSITQMEKDMKGLPSSVQKDLQKDVDDRKKSNAKALASAKESYTAAETILKAHNGKVSDLSDTERTALLNYQRKMNTDEISLLKIGSSAKKNVLAALNGDINDMTRKQRDTTINDLTSSMQKENKLYNNQHSQLKSMYDKGEISAKQYGKALLDLQTTHKSTTDGMAASIMKLDKANGASKSQITQDLLNVGYTYKQAAAIVKKQNEDMSKSNSLVVAETAKMSAKTKSAADSWNKLVFDPKTGKVRTNAQEEVDKAAKSKDKWNSMLLLAKQGHMSSNAAAMVGIAAVQTKRWDGLTLKEKQAMIRSKGGDDLAKLLQSGKQWGKLTMAEKKAIINSKGGPELLGAITKAKTWNKLTMTEKQAVLKDNASPAMKQANISVSQWNKLTPQMKTVVAKAKGAEDVAKGVKNVKDWNSLPTSEKKLIANDKGARETIKNVTGDYKKYENMPKNSVKDLIAKDNASKNATTAKISIDKYGRVKVTPVNLKANDKTSTPVTNAKKNISSVSKTNGHKDLTATNKTGSGVTGAKTTIGTFVHMNGDKPLSATNKTGSGVKSSKGTVMGFMSMPAAKDITANNKTGSGVSAAKTSIDGVKSKQVTITAVFNAVKSGAAKLWHAAGFKNGTSNFVGGTALVNDQTGPVFREAVKIPGRQPFIPTGRNVFLEDLPRGSQIIPAKLTARMYNIPQFANGTIPANSSLIEATRVINDSVVQNAVPVVSQTTNKSDNGRGEPVSNTVVNQLLAAILQAIKDQGTFDVKGLYKRQAKDLSISQYGM